jgi:hypothetical protein
MGPGRGLGKEGLGIGQRKRAKEWGLEGGLGVTHALLPLPFSRLYPQALFPWPDSVSLQERQNEIPMPTSTFRVPSTVCGRPNRSDVRVPMKPV